MKIKEAAILGKIAYKIVKCILNKNENNIFDLKNEGQVKE